MHAGKENFKNAFQHWTDFGEGRWCWLSNAEDHFFWLTPWFSLPLPSSPAAFLPTPFFLLSAASLLPQTTAVQRPLLGAYFYPTLRIVLPHLCWCLKREMGWFPLPVKTGVIHCNSTPLRDGTSQPTLSLEGITVSQVLPLLSQWEISPQFLTGPWLLP